MYNQVDSLQNNSRSLSFINLPLVIYNVCDAYMYLQESGHLNEPAYVIRVHAVLDGPLSQLVPLVSGATVDGQTELRVLVLALLQVIHHFLDTHTGENVSRSRGCYCSRA